MKQLLTVFAFTFICLITSSLSAQENQFIKDYLERFENSRLYLIKVAELMPESNYNFKATPESLSFAENLMHIGFAADWHSQSLLGDRESRVWKTDTVFKVDNKSKKEMIAIVNNTFNEAVKLIKQFDTSKFKDTLDYFGLKRNKQQIFLLLADHISHHRGQMLVYLRLNGIIPPRYVLFQ